MATRQSACELVTEAHVSRIEARRKTVGMTREQLRQRFDQALKFGHTPEAARMRLDRVLNTKMRRPMSDTTKAALAEALGWTTDEFEREVFEKPEAGSSDEAVAHPYSAASARQIAFSVAALLESYQISRSVDLSEDNLVNVYEAAYRMFQRIRDLRCALPVEELARQPAAQAIYDTLGIVLNETLRPHLTRWPERYQRWRTENVPASRKLSPQELQMQFPQRRELVRDLECLVEQLQGDIKRLKSLALAQCHAPT